MRKLLSLTCILSLLFTLVSPAFAEQSSGVSKTSWGMLKSRYGQQEIVERPGVFKAVSDAITSAFGSDASVQYVLKIGLPEQGYVGLGLVADSGVFGAIVDGNYYLKKVIWFDDMSESAVLQSEWVDGRISSTVVTVQDFELNDFRTSLHPEGASLGRTYGCMLIAGVAGDIAGLLAGFGTKNPAAPIIARNAVRVVVFAACMSDLQPPVREVDDPPPGATHDRSKGGSRDE